MMNDFIGTSHTFTIHSLSPSVKSHITGNLPVYHYIVSKLIGHPKNHFADSSSRQNEMCQIT